MMGSRAWPSTVSVADNGLAFTSVAERAGAFWSGRALGVQNTAQYVVATAVAPVAAAGRGEGSGEAPISPVRVSRASQAR